MFFRSYFDVTREIFKDQSVHFSSWNVNVTQVIYKQRVNSNDKFIDTKPSPVSTKIWDPSEPAPM